MDVISMIIVLIILILLIYIVMTLQEVRKKQQEINKIRQKVGKGEPLTIYLHGSFPSKYSSRHDPFSIRTEDQGKIWFVLEKGEEITESSYPKLFAEIQKIYKWCGELKPGMSFEAVKRWIFMSRKYGYRIQVL